MNNRIAVISRTFINLEKLLQILLRGVQLNQPVETLNNTKNIVHTIIMILQQQISRLTNKDTISELKVLLKKVEDDLKGDLTDRSNEDKVDRLTDFLNNLDNIKMKLIKD
jgi:hypothetical protein